MRLKLDRKAESLQFSSRLTPEACTATASAREVTITLNAATAEGIGEEIRSRNRPSPRYRVCFATHPQYFRTTAGSTWLPRPRKSRLQFGRKRGSDGIAVFSRVRTSVKVSWGSWGRKMFAYIQTLLTVVATAITHPKPTQSKNPSSSS